MRAGLDRPWVTAGFGLVVALVAWEYVQIVPTPGLDGSWIIGLNLAAADGLDHGTEIVFTYGPLGFLEQPLVIDGALAGMGAAYLLAVRAVLAATLLWAARRSFSWPAAAALAFAVAVIAPSAIVPQALAAVWCLVALGDDPPAWTPRVVTVGGGALAALEILVKINVGITVAILVAVTVLALPGPRLRNVLTCAGAFALTLGVLWFASGQSISNLDDYVVSSLRIVSGYSESTQVEAGRVPWDWLAALVVGLAAIGCAVVAGARLPAGRRAAMVAVVVLLALALEKYSFVRHDTGHVGAFFGCLAVVWLALRWRGPARWFAAGSIVAIAALYFATTGTRIADAVDPDLGVEQLADLTLAGEREQAADTARVAMREAYAVDPRVIARIGDAPVDARPWELGLIWAHGLNWRPLPVIQDYAAYTPELDRTNAAALAAPGGPRFVLRHFGFGSPAIGAEGRYINFDTPQQARVLLCRFEAVTTVGEYQLLERRDADRCGPERSLGTVEAAYGEPVEVPEARRGEAVFARIAGVRPHGIERLRTLLYRSAIRRIGLDDAWARFAAPNASGGVALAISPGADFPRPFNLAPNAATVSVDSDGGFATSTPVLRYEFIAVPLDDRNPPR